MLSRMGIWSEAGTMKTENSASAEMLYDYLAKKADLSKISGDRVIIEELQVNIANNICV